MVPKTFVSVWDSFDKPVKGSTEAKCRLCPARIKCKNRATTGPLKHLINVHGMVQIKPGSSSSVEPIEIADDDDDESREPDGKKTKVKHEQSTLYAFVKSGKPTASTQSVIAELVSKDGLTFRQIEKSRWIQKLLLQSGFDAPKSHVTVKALAAKEAASLRITRMLCDTLDDLCVLKYHFQKK